MAGNLPVPNGTEVKLVWALNGEPAALNILHFSHTPGAGMDQTKANAISVSVGSMLTTSGLLAHLYTGVTLARTEVRNMDSNSDPWFVGNQAPIAGTSVDNPLPAATAFCVTLKTGLRGRSYNGRVFLWGYTEGANGTTGGITPTAKTDSEDFIKQIDNELFNTQALLMSVVSRWTTPPTAPPGTPAVERNPPILTRVTSIVALDSRWDVQRRRAIPGI